jgi:hypothetical protein
MDHVGLSLKSRKKLISIQDNKKAHLEMKPGFTG